jgi:carbohydrate-binding DOMON domain-containing protein
MIDKPSYIPVKRLLTMDGSDFVRSSYITYQESGSFIRYLIDAYGIDKLRSLISDFDTGGDLDAQAIEVYGVSLDELEEEWKEYLRKIELPELSFSIPAGAALVFGMTDPENDDEGDGDYKYPSNENYVKGCFDLTRFEVFKTDDSVCFRIALQNVIEPVVNRPGGVKFIPAVVIGINKGDGTERQLCRYTNDVELAEGYDVKINAGFGFNVSNSLGKIFTSTRDAYSEMADLRSNTLTLSLPIKLTGEPQDKWRYFVGVGLANEATFNFSGLVPVFKSVPGLISGGNYDYSNPAFIDILLPENIDQSAMLSDYNAEEGKLATVTMVSAIREGR